MSFLSNFISKYNNKKLDFDNKYGHQCFDLVNLYHLELTNKMPKIELLYAYQIFTNPDNFINNNVKY